MPNVIAGRQPVIEALRAGTTIDEIVFLAGAQGKAIEEIKAMALQRNIRTSQIHRQQFRELAIDATTQGVIAVVPSKTYLTLAQVADSAALRPTPGLLLILDGIEDPHNLGALIRTAECAGFHGVVLPKHHAAPVTTAVVKASAGATEYMPVAEATNIVQAIQDLKKRSYWIAGLDAAAERPYTTLDYCVPLGIVVGNEGKGIRRLVKEHCDDLVSIPLFGKIGSLNASVAGALVMYEAARKRGWEKQDPSART